MTPERIELIKADVNKAVHNALIFLVPLIILYSAFAIDNINTDGFVWEDLKPNMTVAGSMILYILNFIFDLSRKFLSENTNK